jgi:hypothetical protein
MLERVGQVLAGVGAEPLVSRLYGTFKSVIEPIWLSTLLCRDH